MKIIINADDLGLGREVNGRIFELMSRGCVTSATLLANGPAIEEAAAAAANFPCCSFGVHLNVTEFRPLTGGDELGPVLDQDGCFAGDRIRRVKITSALRQAIFKEWSAQIGRILSLGVKVSHVDSHHHVHTVPGLFGVLKRVQKAHGIDKVRITKNIYGAMGASARLLGAKVLWNFALRHYGRTKTTSGFTSFAEFNWLVAAGRKIRHKTVELMVHPGSAAFEEETRLLDGDWQDKIGADEGEKVQLISYSEL